MICKNMHIVMVTPVCAIIFETLVMKLYVNFGLMYRFKILIWMTASVDADLGYHDHG